MREGEGLEKAIGVKKKNVRRVGWNAEVILGKEWRCYLRYLEQKHLVGGSKSRKYERYLI